MEYRKFSNLDFKVSAIGLGTWVMGGWLWGGAEDKESYAAIEAAVQSGITLIDTAPVYGFGRSEQVVGKAIKALGVRDKVILATKCGLEWDNQENIWRNSSPERIRKEIDESRKRLDTDVIDIYQIHWPDETVPFEKSMEVMVECLEKGWIRAIGLSNFNVSQMKRCLKAGPIHSLQPPYNLFEREIEKEIIPFCLEEGIEILAYGSICRGLLSGKFNASSTFSESDVRFSDKRFQGENFEQFLSIVRELKNRISDPKGVKLAQLASRWVAERTGITSALVGARKASQAKENAEAFNFDLSKEEMDNMCNIVDNNMPQIITSGFGGPPHRKA